MKFKKINYFILIILLIGFIYRIYISADGNFIFNMDNGRDMVDVREMVVLGKPRLIGPTTSVDGVFYGPAWYYMLSIPFILTGGDPYGSILMEIVLWAFGGYFLLNLVYKFYGKLVTFSVGLIWVASNFIILGSQYAFNPNPILFLTSIFIWSLLKFSETKKIIYQIIAFFIGGLFLQFSVPVGIFTPLIIIIYSYFTEGLNYFKTKTLLLGVLAFTVTLIPQFIFDLRHGFPMLQALIEYRSVSHGEIATNANLRLPHILRSFYSVLFPTFQNFEIFTKLMIAGFIFFTGFALVKGKLLEDKLMLICTLLILVPIFGLIPLKVDLLGWYFNASLVAAIVLTGFIFKKLLEMKDFGIVICYALIISLAAFTFRNMIHYVNRAMAGDGGNSILTNELAAIDFTYKQAEGKNFKVYIYLPSVIDYPYQYLYWWHGRKNYGYLPEEYAYLPGVPEYIKGKQNFSASPEGLAKRENSGLVFLIKEPDQIGQRHLWENSFRYLELIETKDLGSIIVEKRNQSP